MMSNGSCAPLTLHHVHFHLPPYVLQRWLLASRAVYDQTNIHPNSDEQEEKNNGVAPRRIDVHVPPLNQLSHYSLEMNIYVEFNHAERKQQQHSHSDQPSSNSQSAASMWDIHDVIQCIDFIIARFPFTSYQECILYITKFLVLYPSLHRNDKLSHVRHLDDKDESLLPLHKVEIKSAICHGYVMTKYTSPEHYFAHDSLHESKLSLHDNTQQTVQLLPFETELAITYDASTDSQLQLSELSETIQLQGQETNPWGEVDILFERQYKQFHSLLTIPLVYPSTTASSPVIPTQVSPNCPSPSPCHTSSDLPSLIPVSAGLYVLYISPTKSIPLHIHKQMHESEMVWSGSAHAIDFSQPTVCATTNTTTVDESGLLVQYEASSHGTVHTWGSVPHLYENAHPFKWGRVLCIDCPAFIPGDEITIEKEQQQQQASSFHVTTHTSGQRVWQSWMETNQLTPTDQPDQQTPDRKRLKTQYITFAGGLANQTVTFFPPSIEYVQHCRYPASISHQNHVSPLPLSSNLHPVEVHNLSFAVLGFIFHRLTGRLLFVQHKKRGWELPGGKIDLISIQKQSESKSEQTSSLKVDQETKQENNTTASGHEQPIQALQREVLEEAAIAIDLSSVRNIGMYHIFEKDSCDTKASASSHIKYVFFAVTEEAPSTHQGVELLHETSKAAWIAPPSWLALRRQIPSQLDQDQSSVRAKNQVSALLSDNVYPLCLPIALQCWDAFRQPAAKP